MVPGIAVGEEDEAERRKRVKKGKRRVEETGTEEEEERETVKWTKVWGEGRCAACLKEDTACEINLPGIERWRAADEVGRVYKRQPYFTGCRRCLTKRHQKCDLPATRELRGKLDPEVRVRVRKAKEGSVTPSAASSSKRKGVFLGVEAPVKRRRKMEETGVEEGLTTAALVEAIAKVSGDVAESSARGAALGGQLIIAINGLTRAVSRQAAATEACTREFREFNARRAEEQPFKARVATREDAEEDVAMDVVIEDVREKGEKSGESEESTEEESTGTTDE